MSAMPTGSRRVWLDPAPVAPGAPRLHPDALVNQLLQGVVADEDAAGEFLRSDPRPSPDPFLLPGMTEAVDRIGRAMAGGERIVVFGDYDADGVTSTAIILLAVEATSGTRPEWVLPTRAEGYGLSVAAAERIAQGGPGLLVLADCGSRDHEAVGRAQALGMDVVVFDHHQMADAGPPGAIVASSRVREGAPYRELAAAGIAYLFATALARNGHDLGRGAGREPLHLLDLVAIGLIGDASPMVGAGRAMVRSGLAWLSRIDRPGVIALCTQAKVEPRAVRSHDVAMRLAPRVNAPGRMTSPDLALELLLAKDERDARRLAEQVERQNVGRQQETGALVADVQARLAADGAADRSCLLVVGENWHHGIVGLVAGKIAQQYDRPTLLLAVDGDDVVGSARSVAGFDITAALEACHGLLVRFGGHSQAAGLRLRRANVDRLAEQLEAAVVGAGLSGPQPEAVRIRAELPFERMTEQTAELLRRLEPFGSAFPEPMLRLSGVRVRFADRIGPDQNHLKLKFEGPHGAAEAVLWGQGDRVEAARQAGVVDLVGRLTVNEWQGRRTPQIVAEDFRPSAARAKG